MASVELNFTEDYITFFNVFKNTHETISRSNYYDAISSKDLDILINLAKNKSKFIRERVVNNPNATEMIKRLVYMTNKNYEHLS